MANKTIQDFQKLMRELYLDRDQQRGMEKTLLWLQTEQGELVDAYLKKDTSTVIEEVADIFAWLCSVCNLFEIDLEAAAWDKYPNKCPKCLSSPCNCPAR
ncbi:MAG: MazG nucleotide pyrophosphohydrolase domain-containing protein [Candidatus Hodarchaeales archaeon]|jgi:NTP pyrophosphatase (non-canonical NTP hydrolase)